ncbi:MAG: hypothetical protein JNK48_28630 [Bryobacterales bacterium]|nr:hypothetical protein [Bryobacterales bacterium]
MVGLLAVLFADFACGQMKQNPSPMVEHRRAHPRLAESKPSGERFVLSVGSLFVPPHPRGLLVFFHGGKWLPEAAAARNRMAAISVQIGAGSGVYSAAFQDIARFAQLLEEAESKAGRKFRRITIGGWSAGCGALRSILRHRPAYERIDAVLCIDGMHTGYVDGAPGPLESRIDGAPLAVWRDLGRDAIARRKRFLVTHSEIFPGTFASTTETADWLLSELGLKARPVLRWGPMGTQQTSSSKAGKFELRGYAGNSAPDHVDQLHSLADYIRALW